MSVEPLEQLSDRLRTRWGIVGHLVGVKDDPALRAAHQAVQPDVVRLIIRAAQSRPLYEAFVALQKKGVETSGLDPAQRRIVDILVRDAVLSGVGLEGAAKERFNAIQTELAELQTTFSNHVLDATKAYSLVLREREEVEGLPPSALALAAQSARASGEADATAEHGPWRLTLDPPSLRPALQHLARRDLRERLYRAYVTRASSGETDNAVLISGSSHCAPRRRGCSASRASPSSASRRKMAPGRRGGREAPRGAAPSLLHRGAARARRAAAHSRASSGQVEPARSTGTWPIWAERLREERYAYSDEDAAPVLPAAARARRAVRARRAALRRAHPRGRRRGTGLAPGRALLPRLRRRGRADRRVLPRPVLAARRRSAAAPGWTSALVAAGSCRDADGRPRLPVAHLVCNQTPPVGDKPSLMSFDEVETLFHEFGHGLQHMLTRVDHGLASGIRNIEWDAVELPSQFMENWCYHRETLLGFARHYETGEPLPDALFEKLRAARTYPRGIRDAAAALLRGHGPGAPPPLRSRRAARRSSTSSSESPRRPRCCRRSPRTDSCARSLTSSRGGYAAGYYSYKWAEVLSADAFAAFEEAGLEDAARLCDTGRRYRETVLALGGSRPAMEVFVGFRGREPRTDALLRLYGLAV